MHVRIPAQILLAQNVLTLHCAHKTSYWIDSILNKSLKTISSYDAVAARADASDAAFCFAAEYSPVPKRANMEPSQFIGDTGFSKKMTDDTTTATLFIVFPTENVTGEIPWPNTM